VVSASVGAGYQKTAAFFAGFRPLPTVSALIILLGVGFAVAGDAVAPHSPTEINLALSYQPPVFVAGGSPRYLLGTDGEGRDILSRVIVGTRISLALTAMALVISVAVGTSLGVVAGYFGGWADALVMRSVDAMLSLPTILLALMLALTLGPSYWTVVSVLVLVLWARYARLMRGVAKAVRERDFVAYAHISGRSHAWIMRRHILPHLVDTILVFSTLQIGLTILMEASLSFLGAGVPPPTPTLGQMVQDGRSVLELAWWVSVVPGVAIMLLVVAFNNFGDWLRDTLDPKLRQL
jgi:peptide/nickel transport system permease protein